MKSSVINLDLLWKHLLFYSVYDLGHKLCCHSGTEFMIMFIVQATGKKGHDNLELLRISTNGDCAVPCRWVEWHLSEWH